MLKIVLVDDEPTTLNGLAKLITRLNKSYRIIGAFEHPLQALPFLGANAVDVVITDIQMPFMDGIAFIREMKERDIAAHIVLLSGYDIFEYARSAIKYKVADFLLKPVEEEELSNLLFEMLEFKQIDDAVTEDGAASRAGMNKIVQQVCAIIREEYRQSLDLTGIASRVHLNANYLSRLFKNETGESLSDYVIRVRMEQAAYLLRERTDMKIYEIALAAGYPDSIQFSKMFKKTTGSSPKDFRNRS